MKFIFTYLISIFTLQTVFGQVLTLDSLKVLNLEEDKGPFATMNDEVLIVWGIINLERDSIVYWNYSEIHELSDSIPSLVLFKNATPQIDSNHLVFLVLIEVDDLQTAEAISESVKVEFLQYYAHPYNLLKEQIRLVLKDNDLLGFLYFSERNIPKLNKPVSFKGMHMFNRYEYELYWRIE